jgi:hypothetical protein
VELALSGVAPLGAALAGMLPAHVGIGAAEGLLTVALVGLLRPQPAFRRSLAAAALALVAPLVAPLSAPDGLERALAGLGLR